jgi:cell division GTPase FtsZ
MKTTSLNPEYEECVPAAQIRVLWAARTSPNLSLLNAVHVGLGCLHFGGKGANSADTVELLTDDVLAVIANAHLLFVVSDLESNAQAQQIDQACKHANRSRTFRIRLHDDAEAVCVAIRSMTEMLNVYSFIGIDIEDVQSVLGGPGTIKIATAFASGEDRTHVAAAQALVEANLSTNDASTARGILLILSAAPQKLRLSECNLVTKLLGANLSTDTRWVYGMNNDESLGEAIRVTIFMNEALA